MKETECEKLKSAQYPWRHLQITVKTSNIRHDDMINFFIFFCWTWSKLEGEQLLISHGSRHLAQSCMSSWLLKMLGGTRSFLEMFNVMTVQQHIAVSAI